MDSDDAEDETEEDELRVDVVDNERGQQYELERQRRIQQNLQRLQSLGIKSVNTKVAPRKPTKRPVHRIKPTTHVPTRRSSRLAKENEALTTPPVEQSSGSRSSPETVPRAYEDSTVLRSLRENWKPRHIGEAPETERKRKEEKPTVQLGRSCKHCLSSVGFLPLALLMKASVILLVSSGHILSCLWVLTSGN